MSRLQHSCGRSDPGTRNLQIRVHSRWRRRLLDNRSNSDYANTTWQSAIPTIAAAARSSSTIFKLQDVANAHGRAIFTNAALTTEQLRQCGRRTRWRRLRSDALLSCGTLEPRCCNRFGLSSLPLPSPLCGHVAKLCETSAMSEDMLRTAQDG